VNEKGGNNRLLFQERSLNRCMVNMRNAASPFTLLHYANNAAYLFIPNITGLRERQNGRVIKLRSTDTK